MAFRLSPGTAAMILALPGIISFVLAVIAENKKPDPAAPPSLLYNSVMDETTCYYRKDPTLPLGILSVIFLFISGVLAFLAFHYPYNGKVVSPAVLLRSTSLVVFSILSLTIFFVAEALLIWALVQEFHHRNYNVHQGQTECPTAKSGLFGGAGFLALDATLFFLITLMLTTNARSDYLDDFEEDNKGSYGEVTTYQPPSHQGTERV